MIQKPKLNPISPTQWNGTEHPALDGQPPTAPRGASSQPSGRAAARQFAAAPDRMHADGQEHHQRQHRHQEHDARTPADPTEILPIPKSS